ncbi:acyltransferase family protein [Hydrogenophaga sp. IBVHS1]|uniref:acyltransferase family protein n=1 Tax=unclassified Hydrogenophaga TaxID=2610897 RepID=UPI000A2DED2A|nr:acyltransferase family protein [Hydrogenophaga sp. IBVHS1]OSZ71686.1 hypothetical protein CAP37_20970 [Hydrogenophaga sp. IBVHS1]
MAASPPSHNVHDIRLDIQGLRALAVLAVIAFHLDKSWLPSGFVGVDMFFVISGFIISSLLLKNEGRVSLSGFYWSRIKRIVPAYLVTLLVCAVVAAIVFLPPDFALFKRSLTSSLKFTSNHFFSNFKGYFAPEAHELALLHTWSLAIEMQFYLLLPLCFVLLRRPMLTPLFLLLIVAGLAFAHWQLADPVSSREAYFSLSARIPEFLLGSLVALHGIGNAWTARQRASASFFGLILIVSSWFFISEQRFPGLWSLWPCLGVMLVIAGRAEGRATRWLMSPSMVWLGGLSFSLYLWHWPVLAFLRYLTQAYELTPVLWLCFSGITLLLSWLSWSFIETPARRLQFSRQRWPRWLLLVAILVALPLMTINRLNASIVNPMTPSTLRYADPTQICHERRVGDCLRGVPGAAPQALVMGDSHAAQLNQAFDIAGREKGFAVQVVSASNCVPINGFDLDRIPVYDRQPCQNQAQFINALRPSVHTVIVAGMWSRHASSTRFLQALDAFFQDTARQHQAVIVLAQVPMLLGNPVRSVRFNQLGLKSSIGSSADAETANMVIQKLARPYPHVRFLDYGDAEFFRAKPFYNNQLIYMDHHHLNELGSSTYGHLFAADIYSTLQTKSLQR